MANTFRSSMKKGFFSFGREECRFNALLVLRCDFGFAPFYPHVLLRNHSFFLSSCSVAGSNNPNFVIGSTLRSLLDGRRISGSPTAVPHFRPYQRYPEPFGL